MPKSEERIEKERVARENRKLRKQQREQQHKEDLQKEYNQWVEATRKRQELLHTYHNIDEFFTKLKDLFMEHHLVIDGCGCCDSPYIKTIKELRECKGNEEKDVEQIVQEKIDHLEYTC